MQKSLSMDGYHNRPMENRRRSAGDSSVSGGGGGRGSMGYGTDGQFEDVNEEVGGNFFDEEFDDSAVDARSRKRISGSDLEHSGIDGTAVGGGTGGANSARRRANQQGGNKTWHGATIGSERRRPRSLVLPRGRGEPALPWTTSPNLESRSGPGPGSGSGSMTGAQRLVDIDDDEIDYREMMIMTPVIVSDPPSTHAAPSSPSSSSMVMHDTDTRGKGRGRSMHSHARSLDISFPARGHHGHHRPMSPSSFESPSRHDIFSFEEMLPEQHRTLSSSHRFYASSSSSINSLTFGDSLFTSKF